MPIYTFSHPKSGKTIDLFFSMKDEKKYTDSDGTSWIREYLSPQLNTSGSVDPWDSKSFVSKTNNKGTLGDLLDRSSDLSSARAQQNGGVDPVKEKYYENYSKERNGATHRDKIPKTFENKHIKIDT